MFKFIYTLLIGLLYFSFLSAQIDPTKLDDETIDIIKDFEPIVIKANKKHFAPNLPEIKTVKTVYQSYDLPIEYEEIEYKSAEIKPLSYPKTEDTELPFIYLKAGFGNYLTPLIDFQVANKNTDKYRIGLGIQHISSKRKKIENQQYGETDIKVKGEYYLNGMTIGAEPYFNLDSYHFYGYDQSDTSFTSDETRIRYNKGGVKLFFYNHEENQLGLDYHSTIGFHSITDSYQNKEFNFNWENQISKKVKNLLEIGGNTLINFNTIKGISNQNRFTFGLNPYVQAGNEKWQVRGGFWFLTDEGNIYILPDIKHQSKLYKDFIVIYNEWIGHLENNNLRSLSEQNPWLAQDIKYNNYRIENRNFLGFKGNIPVGLDYDARISQIVYYDVPLLVNDTSIFNKFNVQYDHKLKAWNSHVALGYQLADFLKIRTAFDYFNYNTSDVQNPVAWHLPAFKVNLSAIYQFNNKLILEADLFGYSGVNVKNKEGNVEKLKGTVDLNFSANYHLNKNIAFFAQVNNALSLKSKQWYQYPGYGFLAIGGVVVSY